MSVLLLQISVLMQAPPTTLWTTERVIWLGGGLLLVVLLAMIAWRYRSVSRLARELKASEERFRLIAEGINDVFWVISVDPPAVEYVSPAYEAVWGRSRAELAETPTAWSDAILPGDRERVWKARERVAEEEGYEVEYRIVRPDGEVRWILDRGYVVQSGSGGGARIIGVAEDITERKQTEERFGVISQHMTDVVVVAAPDGSILHPSPSDSGFLGYSREELTGMNMFDLVHEEDRPLVKERFRDIVHRPGAVARVEHRVVTRQGRVRHVESIGRNLIDQPAIGGLVLTARDVTERHQLEDQLRHSQKMEAIGRLAGGVAHDFNNLLMAILGHVDLLRDQVGSDSAAAEDVAEIQRAAERARGLTMQLLAFSRRESVSPKPLDLGQLVAETGPMLKRLIPETIRIETDLAAERLPVRMDETHATQVIMNLCVNAADAISGSGRIVVRTGRVELEADRVLQGGALPPGHYALLQVEDDGPGIPGELQDKIFDPFFTTKEVGKGTGLGLSTVWGAVRKAGGGIQLVSEPGAGTRFDIYLPLMADHDQAERAPQPESREEVSGTILVVEDEPPVRAVMEKILSRSGFRVVLARDGLEALERLEGEPRPDLVVSDLVMPRMGGLALVRRLEERGSGIPVLLMTGYTEEEVPVDRGLSSFPLSHLQKPFTRAELLQRVRELLRPE